MQFWLASHEQRAHVVDERVVERAVLLRHLDARRATSGNPRETSFCMKPFFSMPAGKRSIVTGRPRGAAA